MLIWAKDINSLKYSQLMTVYETDNQDTAKVNYSHLAANVGLIEAEQDLYAYLKDVFFKINGAFCAVWEFDGKYLSALRMEPYQDGMLLCGVATAKDHRRQGYAAQLLTRVISALPEGTKIYSHVNKNNLPSIQLHLSCGFERVEECAYMLDGSLLHNFCSFLYVK